MLTSPADWITYGGSIRVEANTSTTSLERFGDFPAKTLKKLPYFVATFVRLR